MQKNDYFLWTVKVSDKGQISIPKHAREVFGIDTGDTLLLLGDIKRGLAIVKYDDYADFAAAMLEGKNEPDNH